MPTIDFENISVDKLKVEIVRQTTRRRFLGGYRNRVTSVVYLHAEAQTLPQRKLGDRRSWMQTRSTQTHSERHIMQQTAETTATQMTGIGVYIPDLTDKLIEPRRYVTADEFLKIRASQVTVSDSIALSQDFTVKAEWSYVTMLIRT